MDDSHIKHIQGMTWENVPHVCLDTETTGLSKDARIVEIALVFACGGEVIDSFSSRVNPEMDIDKGASNIHGIYNEDLVDAPVFGDIEARVMEFLCLDVPLVAHNAPFDMRILRHALSKWPRGIPVMCTLSYSRGRHHALKRRSRHRLSDVCRHFGETYDVGAAHSAMYDTELLVKLVPKLLGTALVSSSGLRMSDEWA